MRFSRAKRSSDSTIDHIRTTTGRENAVSNQGVVGAGLGLRKRDRLGSTRVDVKDDDECTRGSAQQG